MEKMLFTPTNVDIQRVTDRNSSLLAGISGDTHFDEDEHWTIESRQGTDLLWVAVHEFGHALGLDHSSVRGSIMFPWYQGYNPDFKLTEDDIRGIRQLYGESVC